LVAVCGTERRGCPPSAGLHDPRCNSKVGRARRRQPNTASESFAPKRVLVSADRRRSARGAWFVASHPTAAGLQEVKRSAWSPARYRDAEDGGRCSLLELASHTERPNWTADVHHGPNRPGTTAVNMGPSSDHDDVGRQRALPKPEHPGGGPAAPEKFSPWDGGCVAGRRPAGGAEGG